MMFFALEPQDNSGLIYYFKTNIKDSEEFDDLTYDSETFEEFMNKNINFQEPLYRTEKAHSTYK